MVEPPVWGTELFVAVTLSGILAAIWVYRDARRRNAESPGLWAAGVGFLFLFYVVGGIAALGIYIAMRNQLGDTDDTTSDGDRIADTGE